jgi:hypothetical protein
MYENHKLCPDLKPKERPAYSMALAGPMTNTTVDWRRFADEARTFPFGCPTNSHRKLRSHFQPGFISSLGEGKKVMTPRRLNSLTISALFVFIGWGPVHGETTISEDAKTFLQTVRTNFAAWNTSHTGKLMLTEIEAGMQNPAYKGDAGATLSALMWSARPGKDKPEPRVFTLADFDAIEQSLASGDKLNRKLVSDFAEGRRKIAAENRELFADKIPHLEAIRQQKDSDCYFNSAVGSLANERPQLIVKMIRKNPDGSYTVTFPGQTPEKIPEPTDAEIAAYTDASDGIWFNLLEKAYGRIRKLQPGKLTNEPLDAAALHGGNTAEIVRLLTGHETKNINFPIKSGKDPDNKFFNQIRAEISGAFDAHLAVTTGKAHHAYAVVAFDGRTDMFTLHNPL